MANNDHIVAVMLAGVPGSGVAALIEAVTRSYQRRDPHEDLVSVYHDVPAGLRASVELKGAPSYRYWGHMPRFLEEEPLLFPRTATVVVDAVDAEEARELRAASGVPFAVVGPPSDANRVKGGEQPSEDSAMPTRPGGRQAEASIPLRTEADVARHADLVSRAEEKLRRLQEQERVRAATAGG